MAMEDLTVYPVMANQTQGYATASTLKPYIDWGLALYTAGVSIPSNHGYSRKRLSTNRFV